MKKCPECKGSGYNLYDPQDPCYECEGTGEVEEDSDEFDEWAEINAGEEKMEASREPDWPGN